MKVVHLSDLHIGKSNNLEKATQLFTWLLENQELHGSKLVLISGDVVDDGQTWQFEAAREQIERLRAAGFVVLAAPGNHDYGLDGYRENPVSQKEFSQLISGIEKYPYLYVEDGRAFIVLDSMQKEMKTREIWGAQGHLGKKQLQELDLLLDQLADNPAVKRVVVVMHHHPFDYLFYHGLRDHADLKGVVTRRPDQPPRVNALLFGHKHIEHRFNDPEENKEDLYGIDLIYSSGQTVERKADGTMTLPVINLDDMTIQRFSVP